ncbi:hypothetical protein ACN6MY_05985 [Peribacillus sp. B-H-3]|uniref:hypothetical protein n=1 Tax=Peribacillus sp. B-H-3 TaxID=3400420 RepID=UPI003B02CCF4
MGRNLMSYSIIFLGICILLGSWFISQSLKTQQNKQNIVTQEDKQRYELITPNESNIILFDKKSGEYWRRFIEKDGGPTNWEKQKSPVSQH